jgi:hypothetical protein
LPRGIIATRFSGPIQAIVRAASIGKNTENTVFPRQSDFAAPWLYVVAFTPA